MDICMLFTIVIFVSNLVNSAEDTNMKHPKYHIGRYSRQIQKYEIVIPRKVTSKGGFISNLIPHHYKRSYYSGKSERDMRPHDKIHYRVPIKGEEHHLELWPNNEFMSPGMVIEARQSKHTSNIYNEESSANNFMTNLNIRRPRDVQCHYTGKIRGHKNSLIALSTCDGLAGLVRTKRDYYLIEPVEGHDPLSGNEHPHMIYKDNVEEKLGRNCATKGNLPHVLAVRMSRELRRRRRSMKHNVVHRDSSSNVTVQLSSNFNSTLTVEIMVVLDKAFIEYHKSLDAENYVLTVMNMAYNLFHDDTLGIPVNLAIVRIIRLEEEDDEMNLAVIKNAEKTLDSFCTWQQKMNPRDDSHPNHHDVAVLITRTNICSDEKDCGVVGLSKLAGTCDSSLSAAVCEDVGLKLGYIIAHEVAHTLGIEHDDPEPYGCNQTLPNGMTTVMNPSITMKIQEWSLCSQCYFKVFIESGFAKCLLDPPSDHDFKITDILPGVMYGADFQCRSLLYPSAAECEMGLTCDSLNCEVPGYGCMQTHVPPAPGTSCGDKKWCFNKKCLTLGQRPGSEDGGWGEWTSWSPCSRTCGSGVAYQERECNNPIPRDGGRQCTGKHKRYKICNSEPCEEGQPSFRDVQCSEFNNWVFPEDDKIHTWKGHYMHDENPCMLYCKNENGILAALKTNVVDGSTCYRGIRDICIGGVCTEIPCDLDLDSKAVEDRCGVCHGNGTGCTVTEGIKFFEEDANEDWKKIIDVPENARNILAHETQPSNASFIVTSCNKTDVFTEGGTLGMFAVPGSKAWLGMIKRRQEALNIPGPVSKPLIVWINPLENVSVHYSVALPTSEVRTAVFYWDFLDWSKCSTYCGPGTQMSVAKCIEVEGGIVEDKYCNTSASKPEDKSRPCEIVPCVPRWMLTDWSECTHVNATSCEHTREVNCVAPIGEGEGETEIVSANECKLPVPKSVQSCSCEKRKRHNNKPIFRDKLKLNDQSKNIVPDIYRGNNQYLKQNAFEKTRLYKKAHRKRMDEKRDDFDQLMNQTLMSNCLQNENTTENITEINYSIETNTFTEYEKETEYNTVVNFSNDYKNFTEYEKETENNTEVNFTNDHKHFTESETEMEHTTEVTFDIGYKTTEVEIESEKNTEIQFNEYLKKIEQEKNESSIEHEPQTEVPMGSRKGQTIIDREQVNDTKITVVLDKTAGEGLINVKPPQGLPESNNRGKIIELQGNDTLHFIKKIQESNNNEKVSNINSTTLS